MLDQLFSSERMPAEEGFRQYSAISRREFYDGDLTIEGNDSFDMQLDRVLATPLVINHVKSRSRLGYRRSTAHIRRNRPGFKIITIVKTGSVRFFRSSTSCDVTAGRASIIDTDSPFTAIHTPGTDMPYEALQIVVPPDMFFRHLNETELFVEPFDLDGTHGTIFQSQLDMIVRHGRALAARTAYSVSLAMLDALADHLRQGNFAMPRRLRVPEQRFAEVESFILRHLADQNLSYEMVASNCGISTRYLSYLLKAHAVSFSSLVWSNRIAMAREWLDAGDAAAMSIDQIAYLSGFKNASHFARKFKEMHGCSPRDFRQARAVREVTDPAD